VTGLVLGGLLPIPFFVVAWLPIWPLDGTQGMFSILLIVVICIVSGILAALL
jgi:hypothetical protein